MKFKKLVSALTLGTVMSTIALGTVSCLNGNAAEVADEEFWKSYEISQLESQKDKIQLEANEVNLLPGATCEIPIIPEEGNITYDYASGDRDIAVVVEKDGRAVVVAKEKEGEVTITIRSSNNKVGYFKVIVSNVIQTIEEEEIGSESYLSDTSLSNSLPEKILINDNEDAKKLTVVEGESITLSTTLSPVVANGKWQIYWHYDFQDGDDPNYNPTPADYFAYKLVDSAAGGEVNDSGQIDTGEGLWANGIKMGYKVEVMGLKAGTGRKLICESVGGIKREFDVEVIGKKEEQAVANIVVVGNSNNGTEVVLTGKETGFVTAVAYGAGVTAADTFTAESLTPEICTVDTTTSSFVNGGYASITGVAAGTGWVKVNSGSACAVVKVTVKRQEIQAVGNLRFSVTAAQDTKHAKGKQAKSENKDKSEYSNERFIADNNKTQIIGNFFPTTADTLPSQKEVGFITDYKKVGMDPGDMAGVNKGTVHFYDDGTLISDQFSPEFRGIKHYTESCTRSMGDNTMIIALSEKMPSWNSASIRNARESFDETGFGAEFGFVVSNQDVVDENKEIKKSSGTEIKAAETETKDGKVVVVEKVPEKTVIPVFFVMDSGNNDIKSTSSVAVNEKVEYTDIMGDISLRKKSIIYKYQNGALTLPSVIKIGNTFNLPNSVDKLPIKNPFKRGEKMVETKYTFKEWVQYDIANKKAGTSSVSSVTASSSDTAIVLVATYNSEEVEHDAME